MLSRRLLRIKAIRALYAHFQSESDSLTTSEKNLLFSIDKTYQLYHQLLWLIVDIADYAEERIEIGRKKYLPTREELNPNTKFIENQVIARIRHNEALRDYLEKNKLGWVQYPELIKKLHNELIESDFYAAYMASDDRSFREDLKLIEQFYLNIVDKSEELEEVIEEQSIMWADDLDFANIMVLRTLGDMKASKPEFTLLPKFKNQEDLDFIKELFRHTLVNSAAYFDYIGNYTQNWEADRIAFMDNLIMAAAMSELIAFPSIPVKVTLDEFIEISKFYSTPLSSVFINGVLDKIVETLTEEGRIQKFGRGLL